MAVGFPPPSCCTVQNTNLIRRLTVKSKHGDSDLLACDAVVTSKQL
jgi:hypothetical protein